MTDIDLLIRGFRAGQPGPGTAPAAVAAAARTARGPRRRQLRRRLLAGAGVTATVAGTAALLFIALPGGAGDRTAEVPGGYAAVATVRVSAPGGVTDAVMARVEAIIAARAAAQGVAGVEVTRTGSATLRLLVPRSAGWERVRLLTADPGVRILDISGGPDLATAPVVVAPEGITGITHVGGRLRVGVADRTAGDLPQALADGRKLALVGSRDGSDEIVGTVDDATSAALSSEAVLVEPRESTPGISERWVQTLAGGGADASLAVLDVATEGTLPEGLVPVPLEVLTALDGPLQPPVVAGTIHPLLRGVLLGRQVTEWEGVDATGRTVGMLEVPGDGGFSAGCGDAQPVDPVFLCYSGGGPVAAVVGGLAAPSVVRVELRRGAESYPVLRSGRRFVGLLPKGAGTITVVGLDAQGTTRPGWRTTVPDPVFPPAAP